MIEVKSLMNLLNQLLSSQILIGPCKKDVDFLIPSKLWIRQLFLLYRWSLVAIYATQQYSIAYNTCKVLYYIYGPIISIATGGFPINL